MKMYCHWRSQAAYRVRVALNLKGLAVEDVYIDLGKGEQRSDAYRKVNPQMVVPALFDGDGPPLVQSMAILEYLEETHPAPALLPKAPKDRARVRALAQICAADSHPLIVPRVRNYLQDTLRLDEPVRMAWIRHWIGAALQAIEPNLASDPRTGTFVHGDAVSIADICLAGQINGAKMFGLDLAPYPVSMRIFATCGKLDAFARAHPMRQPDAPVEPPRH
jgi:maleylacetoacetate isomerase